MSSHRVRVEAQTWGNTPPHRPKTLYRAACSCGYLGPWHSYAENVEKKCRNISRHETKRSSA